jgi:hypothetical protein
MTGWRIGWLVARRDLADRATKLNEFVISSAPAFAQKAAEAALDQGDPTIREMLTQYRSNRDYCLSVLNQIPGVTIPKTEGAFYLFPGIEGLQDSFDFCRRLLEQTGLGLAPGVAFGQGGEGSIRICYAVARPLLEQAMSCLARFLRA